MGPDPGRALLFRNLHYDLQKRRFRNRRPTWTESCETGRR